MPANKIEFVVKVGNSSNLRFRNADVYRAITLNELEQLSKTHENAKIIVENIEEYENDSFRTFVKTIDLDRVFFYVPDNDENTCGIADELDKDIYMYLGNLYIAISTYCNIDVSTEIKPGVSMKDIKIEDIFFDIMNGADEDNTNGDTINEEDTDNETTINEDTDNVTMVNEEDTDGSDNELGINQISFDVEKFEEINNETKENNEHKESETSNNTDNKYSSTTNIKREYLLAKKENIRLSNSIESKDKEIERLNNVILKLEEQISEFQSTESNLTATINGLKLRLEKTQSTDSLQDEINKLQCERSSLEENIKELKDKLTENESEHLIEKDGLSSEIEKLHEDLRVARDKIDELSRALEDKDKLEEENVLSLEDSKIKLEKLSLELEELKNKYEELDNLNSELNIEIDSKNDELKECKENLDILNNKYDNISSSFAELNDERDSLRDTVFELQLSLGKKDSEIKDKDKRLSEQGIEIDELKEKVNNIESLQDKDTELSNKLKLLEDEKDRLTEKVQSLEIDKETLLNSVNEANTRVESLSIHNNSIADLQDKNDRLIEINEKLNTQVDTLTEQVRKANIASSEYQRKVEELEKAAKKTVIIDSKNRVLPFAYTKKAKIFNVFGSGNYGVTTTAISLANVLEFKGNTLYIDFDLVDPRADAWFKINPIVHSIAGLSENKNKNTGLGVLLSNGIEYFIMNYNKIIFKVNRTKQGGLDYVSGIYFKSADINLASIDYGKFMDFLGSLYDNIVIDFGRLGSSEMSNNLIKIFSDVAYRNICVTTNNKFDIRAFRMRLSDLKIDKNRLAWLLNCCRTTNLDDMIKKTLKSYNYNIMPFDSSIYGKELAFNSSGLTRDRFSVFLNSFIM